MTVHSSGCCVYRNATQHSNSSIVYGSAVNSKQGQRAAWPWESCCVLARSACIPVPVVLRVLGQIQYTWTQQTVQICMAFLTAPQMTVLLKQHSAAANEKQEISMHSFRSGGAFSRACAGEDASTTTQKVFWKSSQTPWRYMGLTEVLL